MHLILNIITLVGTVDPAKSQNKKIRKVSLITMVTVTSSLLSNDRGNMRVVVKVMLKMDTRKQRRRARRRTRIKKRYKMIIYMYTHLNEWNT